MIDRRLFARLVIPLVVLGLVSVILIWPPRLEDLLTNLVVEVAGILITVLFVDWILRTREKEKWVHTDTLIRADFAAWALGFLAQTTLFLRGGGWNPPEATKSTSPDKPWSLLLEDISFDEVHSALLNAGSEDRESFTGSLHQRFEDLIQLYARYSYRLSAEDTNTILELETTLRSIETELSLIDDDKNLLHLVDRDTARLEVLRTKHIRDAAQRLNKGISQSIRVFGDFGFPISH